MLDILNNYLPKEKKCKTMVPPQKYITILFKNLSLKFKPLKVKELKIKKLYGTNLFLKMEEDMEISFIIKILKTLNPYTL
jgi:hypothetical protein